ncbi:hypothetical protein [Rubinisphaera margarita]|uniref:hypothetical protein n=1 Tax=Rubinisphaera margarita TaxID=2909586 RepID=UPI001EE7A13E|nr:hypothetical protein [Rubinisphaera margarita]MCG6157113.1 hypothetical protein [Rubinisphaera margarita]
MSYQPSAYQRKWVRHLKHQHTTERLLRQSADCPSCGAVMDPNARYLQRPRLVGLSSGQKLYCGQCVQDGRYLEGETISH